MISSDVWADTMLSRHCAEPSAAKANVAERRPANLVVVENDDARALLGQVQQQRFRADVIATGARTPSVTALRAGCRPNPLTDTRLIAADEGDR